MSNFGAQDARNLRNSLVSATVRCSERGLFHSAKWAAELASSVGRHVKPDETSSTLPSSEHPDPEEAKLEISEYQRYLLARSYFDCREFDRCSAVFLKNGLPQISSSSQSKAPRAGPDKGKSHLSPGNKESNASTSSTTEISALSEKALFLALYSKYMAGEKRKDEENEMILGPADRGSAINKELVAITQTLDLYFRSRSPGRRSGGWLEYLYGIVHAKSKNENDAKHWLIQSVMAYEYNWSAWEELANLIESTNDLHDVFAQLGASVVALIFHAYANRRLYNVSEQTHNELNQLERIFPQCAFLQTERALVYHLSRDSQEAEVTFSKILSAEPYRLESLDEYSNILYVLGDRPKLAFVAQLANSIDKFRPETCMIIGNYFSMKSEHEKSVQYFRRALQLDRSFSSAWTLMGHEFVEMKNTHAAIESYRRAVDNDRKDYRAWYGLGQTYEVLEMYLYALFYYQRSAALRPYESKMWHALGSCYDKVGRPAQSIKAYKRALTVTSYLGGGLSFASGGPESELLVETLYSIASMYEKLGDREQAAQYMEMTLAQEVGVANDEDGINETGVDGTGTTYATCRARMWLARYEAQRGAYPRAMELADQLCQDGFDVEEAKALMRDIRARQGVPSS